MAPRRLLLLVVGALLVAATGADDDTAEIGARNTLQSAESGGGKSSSDSDSDERKTLSQQVADGKYGLIQRELFAGGGPSAPGVLSYHANPEVPKDNSDNLGGLAREEIWLAEDHLLVLRGGKFELDDGNTPRHSHVPPIDDYRAPNRQVKIPSKPKVPPPFPVQLSDNGPIQILEAAPPQIGEKDSSETSSHRTNKADSFAGRAKKPNAAKPPAANSENSERGGGAPHKTLDEDDPSIYYPPPYSFYYPRDNSSLVAPGPLVPGIVLPPPPNFFGPLEHPTTKPPPVIVYTTTARPTITTLRPVTTTRPTSPTTPNTKLYLPPITQVTPAPQVNTQAPRPVYYEFFEQKKPTPNIYFEKKPPRPPPIPTPPPMRTYVSSTAVPLRAFFKTPTRPAQFYFYEEDPTINEVQTQRPPPSYYIVRQPPQARPLPQNIPVNNFDRHIQQLRQQIRLQQRQQRYHQPKRQPRPVYQYSFGYDDRIEPSPAPPPRNYGYDDRIEPSPAPPPRNYGYDNRVEPTPAPPRYSLQIQPTVDFRRPETQQLQEVQPVTPNPAFDYYTKQDQRLFDDNTKKYFTMFGQKITSPLPPVLRDDINVNYRQLLPPVNPQAEYLQHNIAALTGSATGSGPSAEGGPGTFIAYKLPGDGAHFYFVTPQLAQQRRQSEEDGYYYPAPRLYKRVATG